MHKQLAIRMEDTLLERFNRQCERKSQNKSALLRSLILNWTEEQEEEEKQ